MKIRSTIVAILLIWVMTAMAVPPLRVMSFNIRFNNPDDGDNAWPHRKEIAASMIRFHNADIVGCQEALIGQIHDFVTMLPDYSWFGVGREDGKQGGEYAVILYKTDRFQVTGDSTFWLSPTPTTPSKAWDAGYTRIVTLAKFHDKLTNTDFYVLNTHFDNVGEIARQESAKIITRTIAEMTGGLPVVLTGDFNCNPSSAPYQIIISDKAAGMQDSKTIAQYPHHGPEGTWSGFTSAYYPDENAPIDHIFVRGFKVIRHATLSDCVNGKFPSDHMPVIAELVPEATGQN